MQVCGTDTCVYSTHTQAKQLRVYRFGKDHGGLCMVFQSTMLGGSGDLVSRQ